MDDGWFHPLAKNPYLLLSATCDDMSSWMIESWMKIYFLVSDNNCNDVNRQSPGN